MWDRDLIATGFWRRVRWGSEVLKIKGSPDAECHINEIGRGAQGCKPPPPRVVDCGYRLVVNPRQSSFLCTISVDNKIQILESQPTTLHLNLRNSSANSTKSVQVNPVRRCRGLAASLSRVQGLILHSGLRVTGREFVFIGLGSRFALTNKGQRVGHAQAWGLVS